MPDKCTKYGGECIGCGECDFERRCSAIVSSEDIEERIRQWKYLRKSLHKKMNERLRENEKQNDNDIEK